MKECYKKICQDHYQDFGLLFIRLGLGLSMVAHGWPKIIGGPSQWAWLGGAMSNLGINFAPTFWGFMAAFGEFGGGIMVLTGFFFRKGTFLLFFTLFVATLFHFMRGDGYKGASHALELTIVFFSLFFVGPGKYSIDRKICPFSKR